jgi:hypothetical protein
MWPSQDTNEANRPSHTERGSVETRKTRPQKNTNLKYSTVVPSSDSALEAEAAIHREGKNRLLRLQIREWNSDGEKRNSARSGSRWTSRPTQESSVSRLSCEAGAPKLDRRQELRRVSTTKTMHVPKTDIIYFLSTFCLVRSVIFVDSVAFLVECRFCVYFPQPLNLRTPDRTVPARSHTRAPSTSSSLSPSVAVRHLRGRKARREQKDLVQIWAVAGSPGPSAYSQLPPGRWLPGWLIRVIEFGTGVSPRILYPQ